MLVGRDLGVSSLVLVVCLLFPVIGLVIRRQWRLAEARKAEIKRLLILASEEAARAELEATVDSAVSPPSGYSCAVCYCPTTTRCSRCKAVRYCSGKCQIIHWRQGHKYECHPPSVTWDLNDDTSDSTGNILEKNQGESDGLKPGTDEQLHKSTAPLSTSKKIASDSTDFVEELHGSTAASSRVDDVADKEEAVSVGEASGCSSFSGFSSSALGNESSDDASLCESISSLGSENSESHLSVDTAVDTLETAFGMNDVAPSPLSPKFTQLVESAENFACLRKIDSVKPNGELSRTSGLNEIDRHEESAAHSSRMSSDFWGKTLENKESATDAVEDPASLKYQGSSNNLSESESSLRFSFSSHDSKSQAFSQTELNFKRLDEDIDAPVGGDKFIKVISSSDTSIGTHIAGNLSTHEKSTGISRDKTSFRCLGSGSEEPRASSQLPLSGLKTSSIGRVSTQTSPVYSDSYSSSGTESLSRIGGFNSIRSEDKHLSSTDLDGDISRGSHGCSVPSIISAKFATDSLNASAIPSQNTSLLNGRNGMKTSVLRVVDQFKKSKLLKHYPVAHDGEILKKCSDKGHFSYEVFSKLYNCKTDLQPCGLINCGNSCYANAVLQCLAFTRPLTAYFLQGYHSKACIKEDWCFTCEFEKLVLKSRQTKSALSPVGLLSQLRNLGSKFGNGRQEDAHEFLRFVVDIMQSLCLKEVGVGALRCEEREKTTLISLTFGGYLRSKIKCMKCHSKSERNERMMDLAVEIDGDVNTLEEALKRFTRTEILDGENKYKCERCKSYERAKKKLKIIEAPNILTIALKRFQSGKFGKLNKPIRFPETLDLVPYVSGKNDKHMYQLYGVVVHLDIMNAAFSGHYVCYIKNSQNKWFKADDSVVTATELERVLTKDAYMLFYARCSPRAPRTISRRNTSDPKSKSLLSGNSGKNTVTLPRTASTNPSVVLYADSPDSQASIESFYSKFHRLQRILEEDSLSESSSLFSNSDEGSCTTDSTRGDSVSADEFADFIFGDLGRGWRHIPDTEPSSSSSSSPSYVRHSPLSDSMRYASTSEIYDSGFSSGKTMPFLDSDTSKHSRIIGSRNSSCSSFRETNLQRLGLSDRDAKDELYLRKAKSERTE